MKKILQQKPILSFTKKKFWTTTTALLLFFMMLGTAKMQAQIAFTVTGNTNTTPNLLTSYSSFDAALTALNAVTAVNGDVTFVKSTGTSETAPPKGFTIGSTTLNAAMNGSPHLISIYGELATINAGVGTSSSAGTGLTSSTVNPDGIIKLVGADKIYLASFILRDNNTTGASMMEFGIGLFKASETDGCNNNQIVSNEIYMQRGNLFAMSGPMAGGASGIIVMNSTHTAASSDLTPTSVAGANSFNEFFGNVIDGGINGFVLSGYIAAAAPHTFSDYSNSVNTNGIYNFGSTSTTSLIAGGIRANNQFEVKIEVNAIDNNVNNAGVNHIHALYGIFVLGPLPTNPVINNNDIRLVSGSVNATLIGIFNSNGNSSTVNINDNKIKLGYPSLSSANSRIGIQNGSAPTTLNINNNTIEGIDGSAIGGTAIFYGIVNNLVTVTTNVTTNGNIIRNFERTGASGTIIGIRIFATNWTANGNTIDNLKWSNNTSTGSIIAIYNDDISTTNNYTNNIINNLAVGGSASIYGIYDSFAGAKTVTGNTISNFSKITGSAAGGIMRGIELNGTSNSISQNTIFGFAGNSSTVEGIYVIQAITSTLISRNKIYDLSSTNTNVSVVTAIRKFGFANAIISNNMISGLSAPNVDSANFALNGINISFDTDAYISYNTILLTGTSTGANFSSSAITSPSGRILALRNNILINNMVPKGTGRATVYFREGTIDLTSYDPTSNNNLLVGSSLFFDGTNNISTLAAYKTFMATRDQASVTEATTPFTSIIGANTGFLQLANGVISVANNNALPVTFPSSITTDYFGTTRSTTTPDIGASEFNGGICVAPAVYAVTGGGSGCAPTGVSVGLLNSQLNVNYQLKLNGVASGAVVAGTGSALSFGAQMISGTYTVDAVSNVIGCPTLVTMSGSAIVNINPLSVGGSLAGTKTICNGQSSGALTISGNTGTVVRWEQSVSPFTTWTEIINIFSSSYTPGALVQTTQYRTVSKSGSCAEAFSSVAIITVKTIVATSTRSPVTCNGSSNGAIDLLNVSGGTAPYSYLWNNGAITASITGLSAGTYSCTVGDSAGCSRVFGGLVISQPTAISLVVGSQNNIACFGGTGFASVAPSGGTAPYTYLWTGGGTASSKSGLAVGSHSVTVTDANGCQSTRIFNITQPTAVLSGSTSQTNVACFGGATGAINLTPAGGTPPYTFNWGNGITTEDRTGLAVGTYAVTITDANGCIATNTNVISQFSAITVTMSQTNVSCRTGSNGIATLLASGGAGSYTYSWSPSGGAGATATGLVAGTYTCTVTDANGCFTSRVYSILQPTAIAATITKTDVSCNSGTNGTASIAVSGGTSGYTYNWTPGNPTGNGTSSVTGLTAGNYTCTVTDANGCIAVRPFTISQPSAVSGTTAVTNISCFGGSTGAINLTPTGGTAPYTFNWGNGTTAEDRTGLAAGNYSVTITDANGCTGIIVGIPINQPTGALAATLTSKINTSCSSNSGTATASTIGGTAPYSYDWAPGIPTGDGTANVSGLGEGNYSCTITDSKGCSTQLNFVINTQLTTWNGSAWSNGEPNITTAAIFDGLYTATTNLSACSVSVTGTAVVTIPSGFNLSVNAGVMVAASATLIIESNANLLQISAATNTGNIIVKRDASMKRLDYVFWSSPVANQNLLAFTPLTVTNRFLTLSETGNTFVQVASPSNTVFATAKGYSLRAPNNFLDAPAPPQTFNGQFTGVPNNGDIAIPVTFTAAPFGANGYNLIGNPYPSTVDATEFLQANTGSIYFWTHQSSYVAGVLTNGGFPNYAVFNLAGGTTAAATVLGGVNVLPNGFIQVGQGFMFKTNASKTVTFTNSMREANNGNQFFRTAAPANNKIWLNLTNSNGFFSQTLVSYLPNTSTGFDDSFDAPQLNNTGLSTMISNEKYAIQSRGNFDVSDVVKLNINIATAGNYAISKDNLEGVFSNAQDFFLKDNLLGTTHNIKQTPYNFVANAGETASRFEIVYQSALSNNSNVFDVANVIVFEQNGLLNISATDDLKAVKIFDVQGRNIFETKDINSKTATLNGFRTQQQVLMLQITNANNQVVTKKVIF